MDNGYILPKFGGIYDSWRVSVRPSGAGLGNMCQINTQGIGYIQPNRISSDNVVLVPNCTLFIAVPNCPFYTEVPNCPSAKLS